MELFRKICNHCGDPDKDHEPEQCPDNDLVLSHGIKKDKDDVGKAEDH